MGLAHLQAPCARPEPFHQRRRRLRGLTIQMPTATLETPPPEQLQGEALLFAEVQVWLGKDCLRVFKIPPGEYIIGADPSCHIVLEAENVARMHAKLTFSGHRLVVESIDTIAEIFIGGQTVSLPTPIQSGTEVHVGDARLFMQFEAETLQQISSALADPELGLELIHRELSGDPIRVTGTVAEGVMGLVLQATDQHIRRSVAMKVLRPGFEYASDKLMRFVSEAQLTGQLEHPNIIPVYHLGISAAGQTFYTMKYVRGQNLEEIIAGLRQGDSGTLKNYPLSALLTVFQKVCDAIAFAHSKGIVHRDLKPSNIMVAAYGEVLVMDWGLAKRIASTEISESTKSEAIHVEAQIDDDASRGFHTLDGAVVGTPPYLSPEQAVGSPDVGPGADIYVLGMILYSILALRPPVFLTSAAQVIQMISEDSTIPLRAMTRLTAPDGTAAPELLHCPGSRIPEGLIAIVEKAMAFEVHERYRNVEELQADINSFQNGYAPKAEQAGFFRQLQLLIGRRKREAILIGTFFLLSQVVLAFFLGRLAKDRKQLRTSQDALAKSNTELRESYEHLEQIFFQLRSAAERNYQDALALLKSKQPTGALEQINLAIIAAPDRSKQRACYLIVRAHARTALGFFKEALEDYQEAADIIPGLLPIDQIQSDIAQAMEDGSRPRDGWLWEKITPPLTTAAARPLQKLGHGGK